MADKTPSPETVTAALLVIGEEILSGRTRDENIGYVASYLTRVGIALREVRVVADVEAEIIAAVNELRHRFTYVFTTGGIGPTHDDVTTDAIAKAFEVDASVRDDAVAAMRLQYTEEDLTPARLRMARIPAGAELIHNAVSRAPGYRLENVIVMAGVPRIMQVMLDEVMPRLTKGRPSEPSPHLANMWLMSVTRSRAASPLLVPGRFCVTRATASSADWDGLI